METELHPHTIALSKLCRVCGQLLTRPGKVREGYPCSGYADQLKHAYDLDIKQDDGDVHPPNFCLNCRKSISRHQKAENQQREYRASTEVVLWSVHTDDCPVCARLTSSSKGGRPKKTSAHTRGRPPCVTYNTVIQHIRHITRDTSHAHSLLTSYKLELTCKICLERLTAPVELTRCRYLVCADCCCQWLAVSKTFSCPGCYGDHLRDLNTVQPASPIIHTLLREIGERENGCAGVSEYSTQVLVRC